MLMKKSNRPPCSPCWAFRIPGRGFTTTFTTRTSSGIFPFLLSQSCRELPPGEGASTKSKTRNSCSAYLRLTRVAYIQEYLPHDRDLRVILVNYEPILSYWRYRDPSNFRSQSCIKAAPLNFLKFRMRRLSLARNTALRCKFNDVGLDLMLCRGKWYVIEANMEYGREGLRMKGMNLKQILRDKLLSGELMPSPERAKRCCGARQPSRWRELMKMVKRLFLALLILGFLSFLGRRRSAVHHLQ